MGVLLAACSRGDQAVPPSDPVALAPLSVDAPVTVGDPTIHIRIPEGSPLAKIRGFQYLLYQRVDGQWKMIYQLSQGYDPNQPEAVLPGKAVPAQVVSPQPAIGVVGAAEFDLPWPSDLLPGDYKLCSADPEYCARLAVDA